MVIIAILDWRRLDICRLNAFLTKDCAPKNVVLKLARVETAGSPQIHNDYELRFPGPFSSGLRK